MIVNIDEFYNNKNWKQYVPLEAFQEEMRLVGETFLKDVKVKNVLSITYSIDDYGESPIYIEYLDENDQKHLVKLKPAIHEELDSVLSKYATIDYVNQKFAEAIQTSKDYTDQAKEALTVLINGSKEDAIQVSKAYTDVEINKLNTDLKEYIDSQDQILWQEITTYANSAVNQSFIQAKEYTDTEINKVKNNITTGDNSVLQQAKDYADQKDNVTLVSSKNYTDTKHEEAISAIEEGDTTTLESSKQYTNVQLENYATKTYAENQNKIYGWNLNTLTWDKCDGNFTVTHDASNITKIAYRQTVDDNEKFVDFTNFVKNDEVTALSSSDVEALIQEQNATNIENVAVYLQQKARTVREVTINSTLVETKDFLILNLDFSFVPNILPTSVETNFIENIVIDAPEFNGKSFNITFKANEHTATSKGVVGDPLNIKTCAVPIDETIKNVEVVVKDKIIIRKETE